MQYASSNHGNRRMPSGKNSRYGKNMIYVRLTVDTLKSFVSIRSNLIGLPQYCFCFWRTCIRYNALD
jgi:hypothetical protein